MAGEFRDALIWHMRKNDTKIADLVRVTGISRDVVNKLVARSTSSTTVEKALLIAAYYGKSIEHFMRCDEADAERPLLTLVNLLRPEEERLLEAQIRGIIERRHAAGR